MSQYQIRAKLDFKSAIGIENRQVQLSNDIKRVREIFEMLAGCSNEWFWAWHAEVPTELTFTAKIWKMDLIRKGK